jgi:hypothetical protein
MIIPFEVLRAALNQLLDHAREVHGESIEIPENLYWFVQKEELHDPMRDPTGLTLGSVSDDWEQTSAIGTGQKDPIGYALVWAATVLREIGDKTR